MRSLADIQKKFLERILTGGSESGRSHTSSGHPSGEKYSPGIYSELVATNHLNALRDVYPVCCRLVGERYFSFLAWHYLTERPSDNPDLNRYGDDFPDFLGQEVGVRHELRDLVYLPQVSQLEWAMYSASRADPQFMPMEEILSKMARLGDKGAVLFLINPSLSLMKFDYPVIRIWKENQLEEVRDIKLDVCEQAVVCKNHGDVLYQIVDDEIFDFIKLILDGVTLDELNDVYRDREQRLEQLIIRSVCDGWIVDVKEAAI
jgi:Putative DNA-binding domain